MLLRQVDPAVAHDIAQWFVDMPVCNADGLVAAAYRELQLQTDRQFARLTDPLGPFGYHVVWTMERAPYSDAGELIAAVRATGLLEVTAARAERDRLHPLLECAMAGGYDRFRAVHDITGHVLTGFGFDRDAEYSAWLRQSTRYRGLACWAVATELHAEHCVVWTTRQFPQHKAGLLPLDLLRRSRQASAAR